MKAGKLTLLAALALMAAPALVRADDAPAAKDWHFTVGLKGWANTWSTSLGRYAEEGGNQVFIKDNSEFSVIPNLAISYKDWKFFGSYFANTSYNFGTYSDIFDNGGSTLYEDVSTKAKRQEWDFNVGYSFNPHFMLTVGYKEIKKDINSFRDISAYGPGYYFYENPLRRQKVTGPTIGISVNGNITESGKIKIYGAGVIGFMTQTTDRGVSQYMGTTCSAGNPYCDGAHFSENQFYENFESGFLWSPAAGWALTTGYRYQVIEGNNKAQNSFSSSRALFAYKSTDILRGLTLGVAYTF